MKTWMMALTSLFTSLFVSSAGFATPALHIGPQLTITVASSPQQVQLLNHPEFNGGNQYYNYNFGQVPVNSGRSARFTLTSTGNQPLYLNSVRLYGQSFYGNTNCPYVLEPGCRCEAWVDFRPWYEGNYNGQLIFSTSAGNFIVNLYGWGTRW